MTDAEALARVERAARDTRSGTVVLTVEPDGGKVWWRAEFPEGDVGEGGSLAAAWAALEATWTWRRNDA